MSDNKEKTKDIKRLPEATKDAEGMFKDITELLNWMQSPRIYWDNFAVSFPIENPNEIKWVQTKVEEA
tara:strand:- start:278 stop:481 length:204 start_codon:yes stop_codon:yes gene_type:complete